jgi:hypothetical protein
LTDAIKHDEAQGKQIAPHHFSNEADLINRLALGMTSAKFRVHHEIGKKEPIRDYLTPEQIHCITELQRANTVFISMGWDFEQRKKYCAACSSVIIASRLSKNSTAWLHNHKYVVLESHFHNGSSLQKLFTEGFDNE